MKDLFFHVSNCPEHGCMYNKTGRCMLDKANIKTFKNGLIIPHSSDVCQAKQQLNEHKLEKILSKK